jgi:hypothetical protein
MSKGAAVIAIVIALMVGNYWARWRRAETAKRLAKTAANNAGKGVWRARGIMLLVGVALYVILDLWFRGRGRLGHARGTMTARRQTGISAVHSKPGVRAASCRGGGGALLSRTCLAA